MKKNLIIIICLIAVLIVIGVVFKSPGTDERIKVDNIQNVPQNVTQNGELIVADSYETKTLTIDDTYVSFDVKYPSFKNVDANFNANIETLLKTKIEDHKKASREYWQARLDTETKVENLPKIPGPNDKLSFFSDFTIVQSNDSYISFVLKYGGFSGGAHGYEINVSYNYDVKNKKDIKLADLFPIDPQYLNYLSMGSRIYLENKFAAETDANNNDNSDQQALEEYAKNMISMVESGTEPREENFSVFTFTPDKIKIYFADYQVGPHSIGMPEVELSRE
jgi:hypothetical protein